MTQEVELVLDVRATLGEGAIWDSKKRLLYWVDIQGREVHVFDPATGADRAIHVGERVGTVVPRASGGLMLAVESGFAHLDPDTEELVVLCDPEGRNPDLRFNDGKCDPAGRFWAGTICGSDNPGRAALYCLFHDLTSKQMLTGITNSNGIAWSLDARTMYYIDTPTATVSAFDYDLDTGGIANRRPAVVVPAEMGHPDGMTIDAEGMLWVALWGGRCVSRWDPATGQLLATIPVPVRHVSSCAFGGPDLGDLYITTARAGLSDDALRSEPHAGGLFRARPGVRGVPTFAFAG